MRDRAPFPRRPRTVATLGAALVLGAGGGAAATLALGDGSTTTVTRVVPSAQGTTTTAASTSGAMSVNAVYRQARKGVVDIKVTTQGGRAEGSGFVLDRSGDIVTNQHVVDGASAIQVQFADGTKAGAQLVGADASSDIAVVRVNGVDASKLQPLALGDSSNAQVGDGVIAIGSPYGLEESVTVGVVSAVGRTITSPNHFTISGAIQTDAPINHGNSGGPLLDSQGHVIGVNAQIESGTGESTGVGFAIPSNTVKSVAQQLIAGGKVSHPFLGVQLSDGEAGATVAAIQTGGPAAGAGLRQGDVVTAIDGKRVTSSDELVAAVQSHKVGDKVTLTVRRADGPHQVAITLGDKP